MSNKLLSCRRVFTFFLLGSVLSIPVFANDSEAEKLSETNYILSRKCALAMGAAGIATGAFTVVALPAALSFVGFTAAGIAGGSLAAVWQATMGGVVSSGGIFALLQSISAAGLSLSGTAVVTGSTGVAVAAFCELVDSYYATSKL
ncbi:MAG: interferon alpha-inducible IFI6/IFI27 family protein [Myxococcaceae bacterium]|nr:interferon alpha-inducible IFI6/IFI27 family protein [Myxococcaceae bacterium]